MPPNPIRTHQSGSDRNWVLKFKWYQSLGLGGSIDDFEIFFVNFFLKLFIACIAFAYK